MLQSLIVQLPNGREWEMPSYLAKKLYDFIDYVQENDIDLTNYDFENKWLVKQPAEDRENVKILSALEAV